MKYKAKDVYVVVENVNGCAFVIAVYTEKDHAEMVCNKNQTVMISRLFEPEVE
jgi:hypothetical protein